MISSDDQFNIITPNLECVPERQYSRNGNTIVCRSIPDYRKPKETGDILFSFDLEDNKQAMMVMCDMYIGEYTGS